MQVRRLQEMGGATLLVSLPKEWTRTSSLKKGSVVSLEESADGGLMIYPVRESSDTRSEKEISIAYPSKYSGNNLANEITGAYLFGYDLIKISGDRRISVEDREKIVSAIKLLIGLVVVEEDATTITSQFLVDNTAVEPSKIFRRISSIVRAMISDTLKQLTSGDVSKFESVAQRDDEVDRLHFLLVRLIRTAIREPRAAGKFGLSSIDCLDYRVAASSLETAGDYATELSNAVCDLASIDKKTRDKMVEINDLLDVIQANTVRSFTQRDFTLAQTVFADYKRFEDLLAELRKTKSDFLPSILHFVDTLERIARCQRDIADLVSPMDMD
ncbi:MAG: phosphate uptake regulator PhoU [Thaumarchaeota archaeon]|nr:phosphate uptake regulator PhoU [Nitrososphaerota archaeon]